VTPGLPFRFRPPWWGVVLAVLGCAAGIALGNWQAGRAGEKRAAAAAIERVSLRGEFLERHTVLLDNKLHLGRAGYHVVQPLRTPEGKHVLVNRGWVPMQARDRLPDFRTPAGALTVEGVRKDRLPRALEVAAAPAVGPVRQNLTTAEFAALSGLAIEPWVLEQHGDLDDGLVRDWPRADAGVEKHASYALQWYSLAGLSLVLFVVLGFKRARKT
jgi:surfeit locus 1 family protein